MHGKRVAPRARRTEANWLDVWTRAAGIVVVLALVGCRGDGCPWGTEVAGGEPPVAPERWCQKQDDDGNYVKHGPFVRWWLPGVKRAVGQYADGKLDGAYMQWHANGNKEAEGTFAMGNQVGRWIHWHPNGQKHEEGDYLSIGRPDGEWTVWWPNGRVNETRHWRDGQRRGLWREWNEGGELVAEGPYLNDVKHGTWNTGDAEGRLLQQWTNGREDGLQITLDSGGNPARRWSYPWWVTYSVGSVVQWRCPESTEPEDVDACRRLVDDCKKRGLEACCETPPRCAQATRPASAGPTTSSKRSEPAAVPSPEGTIIMPATKLMWELKRNADGTVNYADPHDADNTYTWCASQPDSQDCIDPSNPPDGSAFRQFLAALNAQPCFAGFCDWRLPTWDELWAMHMHDPTRPGCGGKEATVSCFSPVLDPTPAGAIYWTASESPRASQMVRIVGPGPLTGTSWKAFDLDVRAVRGGSIVASLAAEDREFVDTRGGLGWSDRCYLHYRAGRLREASAACEKGLATGPAAEVRGALLFNLGLIAEKNGDRDVARERYEASLRARPGNAAVERALSVLANPTH